VQKFTSLEEAEEALEGKKSEKSGGKFASLWEKVQRQRQRSKENAT
jgi:hypothetical protein